MPGHDEKDGLSYRSSNRSASWQKLASSTWARLIAKVFLDDPLACPKCKGQMRIVSFVEQDSLIAKILKHLGLWEKEERPVAHGPPSAKPVVCPVDLFVLDYEEHYVEEHSQLLSEEFEYEAC